MRIINPRYHPFISMIPWKKTVAFHPHLWHNGRMASFGTTHESSDIMNQIDSGEPSSAIDMAGLSHRRQDGYHAEAPSCF